MMPMYYPGSLQKKNVLTPWPEIAGRQSPGHRSTYNYITRLVSVLLTPNRTNSRLLHEGQSPSVQLKEWIKSDQVGIWGAEGGASFGWLAAMAGPWRPIHHWSGLAPVPRLDMEVPLWDSCLQTVLAIARDMDRVRNYRVGANYLSSAAPRRFRLWWWM